MFLICRSYLLNFIYVYLCVTGDAKKGGNNEALGKGGKVREPINTCRIQKWKEGCAGWKEAFQKHEVLWQPVPLANHVSPLEVLPCTLLESSFHSQAPCMWRDRFSFLLMLVLFPFIAVSALKPFLLSVDPSWFLNNLSNQGCHHFWDAFQGRRLPPDLVPEFHTMHQAGLPVFCLHRAIRLARGSFACF